MKTLIRRGTTRLALIGLGVLAGSTTLAFAAGQAIGDGGVIHACYRIADDDRKGDLRVVSDPASCRVGEALLDWNQVGPKGDQGDRGDPGLPGPQGQSKDRSCRRSSVAARHPSLTAPKGAPVSEADSS